MQKTSSELLHISLVMLVTAIFYLWFAWDAIVFENAFELAACGVLGVAVCARIIYFVVSGLGFLHHITQYILKSLLLHSFCHCSAILLL